MRRLSPGLTWQAGLLVAQGGRWSDCMPGRVLPRAPRFAAGITCLSPVPQALSLLPVFEASAPLLFDYAVRFVAYGTPTALAGAATGNWVSGQATAASAALQRMQEDTGAAAAVPTQQAVSVRRRRRPRGQGGPERGADHAASRALNGYRVLAG